jgi:hypothetical protein
VGETGPVLTGIGPSPTGPTRLWTKLRRVRLTDTHLRMRHFLFQRKSLPPFQFPTLNLHGYALTRIVAAARQATPVCLSMLTLDSIRFLDAILRMYVFRLSPISIPHNPAHAGGLSYLFPCHRCLPCLPPAMCVDRHTDK